jgi:Endonuclease/Exonuclease/phosphatase family
MGFAKKRHLLYQLGPDIAVIPECSRDSMLLCKDNAFETCWWGENKNKGLGVLAAKPWRLEQARAPTQKWIAPVRVHGPVKFLLLAVWAGQVGTARESNYVGQTYEAIIRHPHWFAETPTVICGDFNSNSSLDEGRKKRKHSSVVKMLADRGMGSAYHAFFAEDHGQETRPTHYFYYRRERPFHIDYIFVPRTWRIERFDVGSYDEWRPASDHVPLWADINNGA